MAASDPRDAASALLAALIMLRWYSRRNTVVVLHNPAISSGVFCGLKKYKQFQMDRLTGALRQDTRTKHLRNEENAPSQSE